MVKYVLNLHENDREHTQAYQEQFRLKTREELIELYNKQLKIGIVGVRMQSLYLYALRQVMIDEFGISPIDLEKGMVISLTGKAKLSDGSLEIDPIEE